MSSRSSGPGRYPVAIALCGLALAVAVAVLCATTAQAADYKMVACAADNGAPPHRTATNTTSPQNPGGILNFANFCYGQGGDPPGEAGFLRISENQASGNAGLGAYGRLIFDSPPSVHFRSAGGYTRQAYAFNDGWRARFVAETNGYTGEIMTQGAGLPNSGGQWASSNAFGPHLWPFGVYWDFKSFIYEVLCVRPAGCDRANFNSTDLNGIVFILADESPAQVGFTPYNAPFLAGGWVRGTQGMVWSVSDQGSGLKFMRVRVDGNERHSVDTPCSLGFSQTNGQWARSYSPCPTGGPWPQGYDLDTASLSDGTHSVSVCAQDFAQYQGLNGTGGESCEARTIRTDNSAPGAPLGLQVTSVNPHRYLDRFGAVFSLPPNSGSPIVKVHYDVINAAGSVVVPERVVSGTNPTALSEARGPAQVGEYRLRVWLEDEVGLTGPPAAAPIPRDTTPPAAPQGISVAAPSTTRTAQGFDVRWHNIVDAGAPIDSAHYQVLDAAGAVVLPAKAITAANPQGIESLDTARERGTAYLRLWLSDGEGNIGAPVTAPLAYDCLRSDRVGGVSLTAGLGSGGVPSATVREREGALLSGKLQGVGSMSGAPLCVFSDVVTDQDREFLGIAIATQSGEYKFPIAPGPSRHLTVNYRSGHRELTASATLGTKVRPTLTLGRKVVHNKRVARFRAMIPGPHNDDVVVVLRAKDGKHWRVFRRCRTREGGTCVMRYRFMNTTTATKYPVAVEVPTQSGYPYEGGRSALKTQVVLP